MLSVVERIDLLDRADALAAERDFFELSRLVASLDPSVVESEPVLRYYEILSALQLGRFPEALKLGRDREMYFERHQDSRIYRRYLNAFGILLTHDGRLVEAQDYFSRAHSIACFWDDLETMADATMNLGVVADIQGRWTDALAAQLRALTSFAALGDVPMVAGCHHNLGMTYRQLGLFEEARSSFDTAGEIFQRHGSRSDIAATALEKALLYVRLGEHALAEAIARAVYDEVRALENKRLIGESQRALGLIYSGLGRSARAARYLRAAYISSISTGNLLLQAEAAEALAVLYRAVGDATGQRQMSRIAYEIYVRMGSNWRAEKIETLSEGM